MLIVDLCDNLDNHIYESRIDKSNTSIVITFYMSYGIMEQDRNYEMSV